MSTRIRAIAEGLFDADCPLIYAAAGAEVIAQLEGRRPFDRDMGVLLDAMAVGLPEVHAQARLSAEVVRLEVGLATAALALLRAEIRPSALRGLRPLLKDIGPPDWVGSQATVVERAGLELLARRPWSARRCANVLVQRGEPGLARWIRIAAAQIERGVPLIALERGMEHAARDRAMLTPAARITLRLLTQAYGEEPDARHVPGGSTVAVAV
ncbi:MAG: hypothetical protein EA397_01850 [Deltaproteobacteria bacterium]|nr:MAG: hypothetical protein EA397_01850 [Deltaproteobacteria bacterium]